MIPGIGVVGVMGSLTLIYACFLAYLNFGILWAVVMGVTSIILTFFMVVMLPHTRIGGELTLKQEILGTSHYASRYESLPISVGDEGVVISRLRPVGEAMFDNLRVEVMGDEGAFISAKAKVRIIRIETGKIIVEEIQPVSEV